MRSPSFWWRASSPYALLLRPFALAYGAVAARRMRRSGMRAECAVVCVGNFTAGGAGKTPTALAIAGMLRGIGERPAFLSRGYGGRLAGPVRVTQAHTADDVGDEPLLLSRSGPAIVARDRPAGAKLAAAEGATVVVMDDGLQNPSLAKDLAIAVVDGATGLGNGRVLPAGPLRAPMSTQWRSVDALLVIGPGEAGESVAQQALAQGLPVLRAQLVPDAGSAMRLRERRVLAFAGIGRPEKFFETLERSGAVVEATRPFGDHHSYTEAELSALRDEAGRHGLVMVTTEKDAVRIAGSPAGPDFMQAILTLPVHLQVDDPALLRSLLAQAVAKRPRSAPAIKPNEA
jgi:tetraacyldisaccharide 4'-kinase